MDIIKLDVPLFIRLMELAREDVKQDADLHDVAEAVIKLSQQGVATMADYDAIVAFMQKQGDSTTEELDRIKQLGGIYQQVQTEFKEKNI
jgi:DNA-binding ferritin-like protein